MVESVVREVLQSIQVQKEKENNGKVLFVFCDSSAHEPFTDQFIKLKNANIAFDTLFLDGETSSWIGMQQVESSGATKVIAADEYAPSAMEIPKGYDGIIIPEIDLDNAARVATGLKGSIKSEIIFSASMLQKFILVGEDVPGIKRSDRSCLKAISLPTPYRKRFDEYIKQMSELGITFLPQKDLADVIINKLCKELEVNGQNKQEPLEENHSKGDHLSYTKKLLTTDWFESKSYSPNDTIYLQKGTIISPLAKDLIKANKLNVLFVKKEV
ncbi:hypothetical protein SAMN05878482_110118 [Peribacillus simplex]|uniref:Uncharacterized protein n=2 Tax=Peribacillus simplex TaxID=1478 RepID=A0A9X8WN21_9BACI|nr:hypothetical protein SAMN05878482_110118 [Peribacillus simplex]